MPPTRFPIFRKPYTKATRQRRPGICVFRVAVKKVFEKTSKLYLIVNPEKSFGTLSAAILKKHLTNIRTIGKVST